MANPQVAQGTLNRLRGSLVWNDFPSLNITSPYLGRDGIRLSFTGSSVVMIDTMTGRVTSPEPYLGADLTIELLKTQPLSDQYKVQMETLSTLGDGTLRSDSKTLSPWSLSNCAIMGVEPLTLNGTVAGYVVRIGGIYQVNSSLFDLG